MKSSNHEIEVIVPGRVNIVGEHTDYAGLPVLPMAIDKRVVVTASTEAPGLTGVSSTHGAVEVDNSRDPVDQTGWARHLAAAAAVTGCRSLQVEVDGDLPSQGGLSSSSALTVGLVIACLLAEYIDFSRDQIVDLAVRAERLTGLEGGEMDQTCVVNALEGHGLRIDFGPRRHRPVIVDPLLRWVVAYSGLPATKADQAKDSYNALVVAARLAAVLLGGEPGSLLGDVAGNGADAEDLPDRITVAQVAARAGVDQRNLARLTVGSFDETQELPVKAIAEHMLSEADRVDQIESALPNGNTGSLGRNLNDSHASLRRIGVSTHSLDRLVEVMRKAGAYGARLTGAGFGGWAVAATSKPNVDGVIGAARDATGGPAFEVVPVGGARWSHPG